MVRMVSYTNNKIRVIILPLLKVERPSKKTDIIYNSSSKLMNKGVHSIAKAIILENRNKKKATLTKRKL